MAGSSSSLALDPFLSPFFLACTHDNDRGGKYFPSLLCSYGDRTTSSSRWDLGRRLLGLLSGPGVGSPRKKLTPPSPSFVLEHRYRGWLPAFPDKWLAPGRLSLHLAWQVLTGTMQQLSPLNTGYRCSGRPQPLWAISTISLILYYLLPHCKELRGCWVLLRAKWGSPPEGQGLC